MAIDGRIAGEQSEAIERERAALADWRATYKGTGWARLRLTLASLVMSRKVWRSIRDLLIANGAAREASRLSFETPVFEQIGEAFWTEKQGGRWVLAGIGRLHDLPADAHVVPVYRRLGR